MIIPPKIKAGDTIRVISPSRSLGIISHANRQVAEKRLADLGLKITFSEYVEEMDERSSSSIASRVKDLHEAFSDKSVNLILTTIGGFNSNEILPHLDYKLIKNNPKVLCGYSDITALSNAIYAKTGLITYSGPHYSSFAEIENFEHTLEYFSKCLFQTEQYKIEASKQWSSDPWYKDQEGRTLYQNQGYIVLNPGTTEGTIIGGNLSTFHLLVGTQYCPSFKNAILFLEDDNEDYLDTFVRRLTALSQLENFSEVKGLVIGRFQPESNVDLGKLGGALLANEKFRNLPIIAGADFGHTTPMITFPVGGIVKISGQDSEASIELLEH